MQLVSRESEVIRRKTASLGCPLVQFPLRSRFGLRSILKMKRLIESVEADIVHTHQFKDTFIALFARALSDRKPKVILTRHLVRPAKTCTTVCFPRSVIPADYSVVSRTIPYGVRPTRFRVFSSYRIRFASLWMSSRLCFLWYTVA